MTMTSSPTSIAESSRTVEPLLLTPEQTVQSLPVVFGFLTSYFPCQALLTIVRLKVPDAIGSGCCTVDDIVRRIVDMEAASTSNNGTDKIRKEALHRCLRLLATCGFFEESASPEDGSAMYRLTPMGALLQTNVSSDGKIAQPTLASGVLHMMGAPLWEAWTNVDRFVMGKTDAAPWEATHGIPLFEYYSQPQHEQDSVEFNEFMSALSATSQAVLTSLLPGPEFKGKRVVDVGGGFGTIAQVIKKSFPKIDMYSLDLPEVVAQARATGLAPPDAEVRLVAGDMFDASTYPANISAVFLKHILHDWDDERCRTILRACYAALPEDGKVLVADAVLPNPGETTDKMAVQYRMDVLMMLFTGKERTKRQWSELAASAGFKVESFNIDSPLPNLMLTTLVKA
jgi:ubiquinone/menaquinone biosynthesis C-methylase UbiE